MTSVSIITPTYNRRHLIGETVNSVLAQSFTDYELIIVDDGSSDGTEQFIKDNYDDPRIKYFFQENKGQNFARNNGLRHAQGEYICFLDSDDTWPDFKLSRSLEAFQKNPDVDVVYGDEMVIDESGNNLGKAEIKRYSGNITAKLLVENFIGMSAAMVRAARVREVGGMDETISVADDYSLWLRLSEKCTFYYLPETLGFYRITANQISNDISARLNSNLFIVTKFLEASPDVISETEKRNALCQLYSKRVRLLAHTGNYRQGLGEFILAIKNDPRSRLPWRSLFRMFFPKHK